MNIPPPLHLASPPTNPPAYPQYEVQLADGDNSWLPKPAAVHSLADLGVGGEAAGAPRTYKTVHAQPPTEALLVTVARKTSTDSWGLNLGQTSAAAGGLHVVSRITPGGPVRNPA